MTEDLFLIAQAEIRRRLDDFNKVEIQCGLLPLQEQEKSWDERAYEVSRRAALLASFAVDGNLNALNNFLTTMAVDVLTFKLSVMAAQAVESKEAA